jgi:hypothetical protein
VWLAALLRGRHRVHAQIKGPSIAEVKHTGVVTAFERMGRLPRKADVGRGIQLPSRAIGCDISKRPL